MTGKVISDLTALKVKANDRGTRRVVQLDSLPGITVLLVVLELPLNRWLPIIAPAIPDAGALAGAYRILTSLGGMLYYVVVLSGLLFFAGLAYRALKGRAQGWRESLTISAVLTGLVAGTASFIVFPETWNTMRLLIWLVLAILLLLNGWARSSWGGQRALLAFTGISYISFVYHAASSSVSRFLGFGFPLLALTSYRFSESTVVVGTILLPVLLWPVVSPLKTRSTVISAAFGVFLGGGLSALAIWQPANTQLVVQWTSGLSFELPLALYVLALASLGFTTCASLFDARRRSMGYGLVLLSVGGFAPSSLYQYTVTLVGVALLARRYDFRSSNRPALS
ncbi:MAG: hypothetical protein M1358_02275 [Chloroflexi bacterium]|nr:hypothetical protein [Chloroflexota bacterium]